MLIRFIEQNASALMRNWGNYRDFRRRISIFLEPELSIKQSKISGVRSRLRRDTPVGQAFSLLSTYHKVCVKS
jgi:hypothetical protein